MQTAIALLKSFIGSGITFLPGGFAQGGWVFASSALLGVAVVQGLSVSLLLACCERTDCHGYGEIARLATGRAGELAVQASVVFAQLGTCVAYMAFVAKILAAEFGLRPQLAVLVQLPVLVPLCRTRSLRRLECTNLVADALIIFGLAVILAYGMHTLLEEGAASDVTPFHPSTCGLFLGFACFAYEGIPLLLPLRNAMHKPEQFRPLYFAILASVAIMYIAFGLLNYLAYGEAKVQTVVLLNLPNDPLSLVVKLGYVVALVFSVPLNFLPAARITESWVFSANRKGEHEVATDCLRAAQVGLGALAALIGGRHFNKLLSFIGTFCTVPIMFIWPVLFHLLLCSSTWHAKAIDVTIMLVGVAFMILTMFSM